jgi:hypothetical protein
VKTFAVIFGFYTVALSLTHCCDKYEQANTPQTVQQSQEHHEQDHNLCSPFCQCNCCHGFIVLHFTKHNAITPAFAEKPFQLSVDHLPSSFAADFWQPPRLS